ncbi:MAG: copper homeostasis protein CutC [Planctomycetes bacterium]|nr:copper homeostasis protein CutC [Planctomycetota bacterium]
MVLFEACVDSLDRARAAFTAGAGRLELCSHLEVDGLTPDPSLLRTVLAESRIPVFVMIRLRGGAFTASEAELLVMESQIDLALRLEAHGVVMGVLREDGRIDVPAMRRLIECAKPLPVTFHRAFDRIKDKFSALETLVELGASRILTSGGAPSAWEGREMIRGLVEQSRGRVEIVAGGKVRADHWRDLVRTTGVREIHGSVPIDVREK